MFAVLWAVRFNFQGVLSSGTARFRFKCLNLAKLGRRINRLLAGNRALFLVRPFHPDARILQIFRCLEDLTASADDRGGTRRSGLWMHHGGKDGTRQRLFQFTAKTFWDVLAGVREWAVQK